MLPEFLIVITTLLLLYHTQGVIVGHCMFPSVKGKVEGNTRDIVCCICNSYNGPVGGRGRDARVPYGVVDGIGAATETQDATRGPGNCRNCGKNVGDVLGAARETSGVDGTPEREESKKEKTDTEGANKENVESEHKEKKGYPEKKKRRFPCGKYVLKK